MRKIKFPLVELQIVVLLAVSGQEAWGTTTACVRQEIGSGLAAALEQQISEGQYRINRRQGDIQVYVPEMIREIKALGPEDILLDAGCGDGELLLEVAAGALHPGATPPKSVGVTYQLKSRTPAELEIPGKLTMKVGRYFEQIPDQELIGTYGRRFSLITDYFGVMSYTADPLTVLSKFHSLLKPGGKVDPPQRLGQRKLRPVTVGGGASTGRLVPYATRIQLRIDRYRSVRID